MMCLPTFPASKFEILELHDIEKEFVLVDARLRLIANEDDQSLSTGKFYLNSFKH